MALLGDDGLGYELASRLQSEGVWRAWLGEKDYSFLQPHLVSSSSWAAFMQSTSLSSPTSHLSLQLRVRALLYDKASVSLFLDSSTSLSPSSLDSSYLQLHADSVYFSLEQDVEDWSRLQAEGSLVLTSLQMKFGADLLATDVSADDSEEGIDGRQKRLIKTVKPSNVLPSKPNQGPKLKRSHSSLHSDRPETSSGLSAFSESMSASGQGVCEDVEETELWYHKLFEKSLMDRMHRLAWRSYQQKLPFKDRESFQRTPQSMGAYLASVKKTHKRRHIFKLDQKQNSTQLNQIWENGTREPSGQSAKQASPRDSSSTVIGEDFNLLPEVMFPWNCVPDNPVPGRQPFQFHHRAVVGTFDKLQQVSGQNCEPWDSASKDYSELQSEIMPLKSRQFETLWHTFNKNNTVALKKQISDNQASHLLQQVVVDIATTSGFHGLKQTAMDSLSRLFTCHIQKLGSTLRLLVDRYQNRCSQRDLLKIFLRNSGCGDTKELLNVIKSHQQMQSRENQMHIPGQAQVQQAHPDLEQSVQQPAQQMKWHGVQLQARRTQQMSLSRNGSTVNLSRKSDKERPVSDIKNEMTAEPFSPADPKPVLPNVSLISQQQLSPWQQQQPMQATALHHPYAMPQMKQLTSLPLSSMPQQSLLRDSISTKIPHLKVEGVQELISPDGSMKHELEDDKEVVIGSPSRRRR